MPPRPEVPPAAPSPRDAVVLADVLHALREQLEGHTGAREPDNAQVEALVSAALAELQRLAPLAPARAGIAPALGSGVLQELLRHAREGAPSPLPEVHAVDTRR